MTTLEDIWYLGSVGISRFCFCFFFLFLSQSCNQEMSVTSFRNCVECYLFHANSGIFFLPSNLLLIVPAFRKYPHLLVTFLNRSYRVKIYVCDSYQTHFRVMMQRQHIFLYQICVFRSDKDLAEFWVGLDLKHHTTVSINCSTLNAVKMGQYLDIGGFFWSFQSNMIGEIILELNLYYVSLFTIWPGNSLTGLLWKLTCDTWSNFLLWLPEHKCHFIVI